MSSSDASSSASSSNSESSNRGIKRKRDITLPPAKASKARKGALELYNEDADSASNDSSSDNSDSDSNSDSESKGQGIDDDVQVLSHAAQRKLKKMEQRKATGDQPSTPAADATPKRQNSVWVGNLAFKTTEQSLGAFFQRGIPNCEVTRINLPTKTGKDVSGGKGMRGENRGFAYVDFATNEAKGQAIALSEQNLDGRKLLIKDGGDFTGRPTVGTVSAQTGTTAEVVGSVVGKSKTAQRILAAQKQPPAPTLFLGNLGFQATEESIREMLEGHKRSRLPEVPKDSPQKEVAAEEKTEVTNEKKWLRKVRLGTFEDSGLCKGWAFVDFVSIEDATAVLIDPRNHHLDGRKLVVEYASAEAVRRGGGPGAKAHRDSKETSKVKGETRRAGRSGRTEWKSEDKSNEKIVADTPEDQEEPPQKKAKVFDGQEREIRGGKARRTKPGAALALAKREKVAIVPSSGTKIIF